MNRIGDTVKLHSWALLSFRENGVEASEKVYTIVGVFDHLCTREEMEHDPTGHPLYHVEDEGTRRVAYLVNDEEGHPFGWFMYEDQVYSHKNSISKQKGTNDDHDKDNHCLR